MEAYERRSECVFGLFVRDCDHMKRSMLFRYFVIPHINTSDSDTKMESNGNKFDFRIDD